MSTVPPQRRGSTVPPCSDTFVRIASPFPQPFDAAKVERLRAAVEEGSLEVDALLIAEKLLADER